MFRKSLVAHVVVLVIALTALGASPALAAPSTSHGPTATADSPAWAGAGILDLARAALGWFQNILPGGTARVDVHARAEAAKGGDLPSAPTLVDETLAKAQRGVDIDPNG